MMVSIVIPIYNVEQYIIACLKSVEKQSYTDFEVILVDDCGTDNSMLIAKDFIKESKIGHKIRIISNKLNLGPSVSRNNGTEQAKGTYIFFLDSDDTLMPDCLERLVSTAKRTDADIVVGNFELIGDDRWIPRFCDKEDSYTHDAFRDYLQGNYYLMVWNKLIKRDVLIQNHISFPVGIHHGEDAAWSFSLACVARKVDYVNDITYKYYIRTDGLHNKDYFQRFFASYIFLIAHYSKTASINGKANNQEFLRWYERQKALHFGQTMRSGTKEQLREIYSIIRKNLPMKGWNKMQIHYYLPSFLGVIAYKKWHGMWLM